ncbi:hypothetical protein [Burkholderia gladioli]|jgi:predicted amidophosphoribosyltransferase|uniref:hypothetical protein n=1 Tax=Burkholderia gladioli TaxID=28095 RepID=UPI00163FE4E0|nr:hypothetical protein [Burkholderia gladioli]
MNRFSRWFDTLRGALGGHAARPGQRFTQLRSGDARRPAVCRRCRAPLEAASRMCTRCGTRVH